MIEKIGQHKNKETVPPQAPYDEKFDWDALWDDPNFAIDEHPELWDNWETHLYLSELHLKVSDLKDKRLLDVGCGSGAFVRVAKSKGADVMGLDKEAHEILRERPTPFMQGDATKLPFENDTFDLVVSKSGPLQNIQWFENGNAEGGWESQYPAIAEAIRVLRPGGEIRFPFLINHRPDLQNRDAAGQRFIEQLKSLDAIEFMQELDAKDREVWTYASKEDAQAEKLTRVVDDAYVFIIRKK